MLERQFLPVFGTLRLDRIRRRDVERWFDAYSETAPGGANHALQLLRQILGAALAAGLIETNPAQGIAKNPRPKLTRFLSAEEIDRLHRALDRLVDQRPSRQQQADIIRLLLLTGCRRGEIVKLKWSEVDGDALRLTETKTGPRTVWLSGAAPGDPRPSTESWSRPCVPVAPGPRKAMFRGSQTLVSRQEGSGDRGCPPARSAPHRGEPGRGAGRRPAHGRQDARARGPDDDPALRPCRRSGRGSRRREDREGDRMCNEIRSDGRRNVRRFSGTHRLPMWRAFDLKTFGSIPAPATSVVLSPEPLFRALDLWK